jgi:hypothetical protein
MRHLATTTLLLAAAALLAVMPALAATRTVPAPYATIQSAINASVSGDAVSVGPGTFMENVIMKNGVTVQGAGIGVTVIDGKAITYAVYIPGGASSLTKLLDLTVKNGNANVGGGIKADNGNRAEIRRVEVRGNIATSKGGGIYVGQSSATKIAECVIVGNRAPYGGGIYLQTSQSQIEYNLICDNVATTAGGGIYAGFDQSAIIWNTIDGNSAPGGGAGAAFAQSNVRLHTTIFSNNSGGYGLWTNSWIDEKCNDFWANGLGGMFGQAPDPTDTFLDPMYCDRPAHDLHLDFASPCVLGSCEKQVGALGPACGVAPPTSAESRSWGEVKGIFK